MSHCNLVWFNVLQFKVFKPNPVPKPEPRVCPDCECELVNVQPINSEAEAIVKSKIDKEGIYRFETFFLRLFRIRYRHGQAVTEKRHKTQVFVQKKTIDD